MPSESFFYHILRDQPANNPPYLTWRGIVLGLCVAALIGGALLAIFAQNYTLAEFCAAAAAALTFVIASSYLILLMIWRSCRTGHLRLSTHIQTQQPRAGVPFELYTEIDNGLPFAIDLETIVFHTTRHIRIDSHAQSAVRIPPHRAANDVFKVISLDFGNAAVIGAALALSDAFGLFRAEIHIPCALPIDIVPNIKTISSQAMAPLSQCARKLSVSSADREPENLRPFVKGDELRKILWRSFAKYRQLIVRTPPKNAHNHYVLLIDAGIYMRFPHQNAVVSCPLSDIIAFIMQLPQNLSTVSIVAYDEYDAHVIANHSLPATAMSAYVQWLNDALSWRPLPGDSPEAKRAWQDFAAILWRDCKRYRNIDFSTVSSRERIINLSELTTWARSTWILNAYHAGDFKRAKRFADMDYAATLEQLLKLRCRWPAPTLPSVVPVPNLAAAWTLTKKILKTTNHPTLVWFSDFASPLSENVAKQMMPYLKKYHVNRYACFMQPPEFAHHFSDAVGKLNRKNNKKFLAQFQTFSVPFHETSRQSHRPEN